MAKRPEDYTSRTFLFAMATLVVLMAISVIPPIEAGGVSLRRANILSDLIRFDSDYTPAEDDPSQPEIDVEEFHVDLEEVERQVAKAAREASPTGDGTSVSWQGIFEQQPADADTLATHTDPAVADSLAARNRAIAEADFSALLPPDSTIIPVEEFHTGEGPSPLQRLYDKLLDGTQPVRVAFMGDSFVEGDILTADLREMLQETFGGGGVGFVPAASPFTGFRQTVKTTSKGWTPYNIMQRKSVPDPYAGDFFVSGWVAAASDGASTRWDMTTRRRHLDECRRARLLFISRKPSQVSVTLNDGEVRTFGFEGDEVVRQIVVEEPQIRSLEMRIDKGAEGFSVYGADFDELSGVAVDNFSIRSNNGQAMFWTSPTVNAQINSMRPYDLVILQYGLNIMQADRHDYSLYAQQIEKMIRFVRSCFPQAAVIVMGVSDRSQRGEDGIVPMESARDLSQWQRTAAEQCGAAFWNTYDAMQLAGGMTRFVDNGWAGKDYTHINYAGGAQVARALYYGLLQGVQRHLEYLQQAIERQQPVIAEPLPDIAPASADTLGAEPIELPAPPSAAQMRPEPRPLPRP